MRDQKKLIRAQFQRRLRRKPPAERAADSAALCDRLMGSAIWENVRTALFFAPLPDEPDIWPVFLAACARGLTVALPRYEPARRGYVARVVRRPEEELVPGYYGIREPRQECAVHPLNLLDLVLVPGVAFDMEGRRLGRGAGYYDRLLKDVQGTICGIAFDEQISGALPVEPHDVFVDCIPTPTRWLEC